MIGYFFPNSHLNKTPYEVLNIFLFHFIQSIPDFSHLLVLFFYEA